MALLVAQTTQTSLVVQGNLINCFFILDNSGSMSGSKWSTAKAGVLHCISELHGVDFVSLMCFGDKLRVVDADQKKDLNVSGLFNTVHADGSGTKLYDAMVQGGTAAVQMHLKLVQVAAANNMGCHTHIIVLTDGDDNMSSKTKSDVMEFLEVINKLRGIKVTMAGVELGSKARSIMSDFGSVGDSDIQYKHLHSAADISDLFQHVALGIRQQRGLAIIGATGVPQNQTRAALPAPQNRPRVEYIETPSRPAQKPKKKSSCTIM